MTAILFDTLKLARRLEGAGFSRDQANGAAEAIAEGFSADIATKTDIAEVKTEIATLRGDMHTEFASLRTEIAGLRGDMNGEVASVRTDIASLRGDISGVRSATAQWIVGAAFVNVVGMLGAVAAVWQLAHK